MGITRKILFVLTLVTSVLLLVVWVFGRSLDEVLTPFILGPVFFGCALALVGFTGFWLVDLLRMRRLNALTLLGASLGPLVLAAVMFFPLDDIQMRADFRQKRAARESVVRSVQSGELKPRGTAEYPGELLSVRLSGSDVELSHGGNEIFLATIDDRTYIEFFFYRGILDSFSAFVFVPEGGSIDEYERDIEEVLVEPLDDQWYFVRGQ